MTVLTKILAAAAAAALATTGAALAHDTPSRETVTAGADFPIPNIPGRRLVTQIVDYPPGANSLPHRHAPSAFIYAFVVSGEIRSQVDGGEVRVYRPGEGWFENPGAHHVVSANNSRTEPARLLAIYIVDSADAELVIPDAE